MANKKESSASLFDGWKKMMNVTERRADKQGGLHSNKPINAITGIPEMGVRYFKYNEGLGESFRRTFYDAVEDAVDENGNMFRKGKGFRWGKAIGSVWGAYTGAKLIGGALEGALTDSNGNFNVPGIPGI